MSTMRRLEMSPGEAGNLVFNQAPRPEPGPGDALIRVSAFSMNRGELGMASDPASKGRTIGWDFAGSIELPAADGSTPTRGTRVVGWRPQMDAWAEYVACPASYLAEIPDSVPDGLAATLPVAGLTALASLDKGTRLVGNRVLVTGITGGVGGFALQLAKLSGAHVVAQVRKPEQSEVAKSLGADEIIVSADGSGMEHAGQFRLIVDGVGGSMLSALVRLVAKGGTLVCYGVTGGSESTLHLYPDLFGSGGQRSIYGLTLYTEAELEPSSIGLSRLLSLAAEGRLRTDISHQVDWSEAPSIAQHLIDRRFSGKAVLTLAR